MSIASAATSAVTDALGIVTKAQLTIRSGSASSSSSSSSSSVLSSTSSALSGTTSTSTSTTTSDTTLSVQYNPSSLSLQANAQPIPITYLLKNTDSGVPNQSCRPPSVTLRVDLIFDDLNTKDAFAADKLRIALSDIVTDVAALVSTVTGDYYSVQTQTNGLVAMLSRKASRRVTFSWADFSFDGEVQQVQARYTMFSPSGRPIRSVVTLDIRQDIATPDTSYDDAFNAKFLTTLNPSLFWL